jgi:hypothetical protein
MRLPKQLDKCDHPWSRWLRIYNILAADIECRCCVFWRGFIFAVAFFALPVIALLMDYYLAGFLIFAALIVATAIIATYHGDPLE